jgi:plasmid maintenance system antidote protein VapI
MRLRQTISELQKKMRAKPKTPKKSASKPAEKPLDRLRIQETRLVNLGLLVEKFGQQDGGRGKLRRFAAFAKMSENHLSQILNRDKGIGDELAKKLEDNLRLGEGWLDAEHSGWTAETSEEQEYLALFREGLRRLSRAKRRKAIKLYRQLVDTLTQTPTTKKKTTRKKS